MTVGHRKIIVDGSYLPLNRSEIIVIIGIDLKDDWLVNPDQANIPGGNYAFCRQLSLPKRPALICNILSWYCNSSSLYLTSSLSH